jgi:hypothetical protein
MDVLTTREIDSIINTSKLVPFYNREIDRESAFEILSAKIGQQSAVSGQRSDKAGRRGSVEGGKNDNESGIPDVLEEISKNPMARQIGRTLVSELTRGIFGMLGGGKRRR